MPSDVTRLIHGFFHSSAGSYEHAEWAPPVDIYRMRDGWLVKFDLAGVQRTDLNLSVSGRRLTLRGRRRDWCVEQGDCCAAYSMEITYSEFHRSVELPVEIDKLSITTDYRDGMLLVRLAEHADR